MTAPSPVGVEDALSTLVQQFSDPLACLRELVQNSLDAGSRQVDIAFAHDDGVACIHVDDYGEGMDRRIIDSRLTRLFSSAKDGDMTKIGRFGIGFVSVFALEPDAVCVDTGRGAENWRILFSADRSFTRIALDEPVDGTRVRIFKAMDLSTFEALRTRARDVLTYWCKHVDGEVYFDDEPIATPLALDAEIQVRHVEEGTTVLVGFRADIATFAGFYNKGLTLHERHTVEQGSNLQGIAFKVSSRYLEHTLTRDNVLHDAQFEQAMQIVNRLASRDLVDALHARLADPADVIAWEIYTAQLRFGQALHNWREGVLMEAEPKPAGQQAILMAAGDDRLMYASKRSALAKLRGREGDVVLIVEPHQIQAAEAMTSAPIPHLATRWLLPEAAQDAGALEAEITALLAVQGIKVAGVRIARWGDEALADRVAIAAKAPDQPVALDDTLRLEAGFFERKRWLVINADHPTVAAIVGGEPEMAAWLLVRLFFLGNGLTVEVDSALAAEATTRRQRRLA